MDYDQQIADEGQHWFNLSLDLIRKGTIPYCCDFRLHLAQLLVQRAGLPFHLGAGLLPTRFREVRNVLGGAAEHLKAGARQVLDLGAGGGWLSLEIARQGGHVLGLDVSKDNLRLARFFAQRHEASLPFLYPRFAALALRTFGSARYELADLNRDLASIESESFDLVTVWDSLHHVRELGSTLREVSRALRPGGFFIGHDFIGPQPETKALCDLIQEQARGVFRTLSSADLGALRRHVVALGRSLPLGENAVDHETRMPEGTGAYIDRLLLDLKRDLGIEEAQPSAVVSPFEEVSISYLLTELDKAFEVRSFYTMGAYFPEGMPPPPPDEDDVGGIFFHYLSYLFLLLDDLLIDSGAAVGRYVCFVAVPRGRPAATPRFSRSAAPLIERLSGAPLASASDSELRDRVRLLETENRILRRIVSAPPGPASDAGRFYFKLVRPILLGLTGRVRRSERYRDGS